MKFDASEVTELAFDIGKAPGEVIRKGTVLIAKTAYDIERDMKILAAVDSGNMRDGVSTDARGLWAEIGPVAEYSEFVDGGTSTQAPQPFVGPAADRNIPGLISGFGQIVGDIL